MNESMSWWRRALWSNWPHRLTVLLVGLFMLQFVFWFAKEDHLWLPETVVVVELVLLIICVVEHVTRLHWAIRGLIQLIAVIAVHVQVLHEYGVIEKMKLSSFFSSKLFLNLYNLTPYLWFGLAAWAAYLTLIWWVAAKWRVYVLLVASVVAMCIRDSFSSVYLWPQVAMTVGCGLFLLILCHFQSMRQKDPTAWSYLADYPASIAVPVILLISMTVVVGAIMPEVGPMVTDPYTAWRAYRGEAVNFTTGKGVEVAVSASDTSSGYSRSDAALGSGFQFDYTPVMTVDTTHRSYWRGETRSLYTGKGWEPGDSDRRSLTTSVRADNTLSPDPRKAGSKLKTIEVKQVVSILSEDKYPVLFGAFDIQKVEEMNGGKTGFESLLWAPSQSEIRINQQMSQAYPKTYTVVSQMPVIDEEGLRQAPEAANRTDLAEYLQLPDHLPARVRQLAADITKDAADPYDKAKAIEQYLRTTYPYTNKPDLTKGKSRDFVDRFLFEIKEGYCDYYSSAMAVLSRSVGLPTRWVKGYASGQSASYDEMFGMFGEPEMTDPDAAGVYTVRNADAHSWVEVYFSGWGWIPFEPTSGFLLPRAVPQEEITFDTSAVPEAAPAAPEPTVLERHGLKAVISGIVLLAAAAAAFVLKKLQVAELLHEKLERRRASLLKQKVIIECERLIRICKRNGYVRHEHETLREAIGRWSQQSKWMKADLEQVLGTFEKAKYSNAEITEQDWQSTAAIVEKLRSQF
ncbi:DUF3488 and transglutaminase-like domain-containing protein [Paenibacillus doosanensis]|uniref:Protein-glutamine gamma-glutamyltransferase n=1 Tax=Paenibacillus konkukensis TaxID=2020716 RepID=A0ABY4RJP8_9BACL|nr:MULTISPECIES: transglutaminase domain-containing protein [Paenibacillus]MCS7461665.1 DUF3488 and transglutaminase-like domain-containing protein [Paenibacillus doosanensis]UQZ82091.1 Protein-glutamine gamma-glutamyltransferase [Paenibacillus konkukensis]